MAFPLGRQKGIFLSLDVSVALLVIFTAVMLSFAYFSQIESYGPSNLLTRGYLQDAVSVMSNRGDFAIPLISKNRPDTTGISEVLAATPSSVCMQVEAYGVSVPDGLEAYWKLDEDTGATTVADSSGNGVVGAINGSVYFSQPSRTGLAILFDGSTGLISASVPALSGAYTFTEAAWVNFKSLPNAFPSIITRNGTLDGAIFLVQTGSHAGVQTGSTWTAGSTELSPNTWYHIAATYDGTTVRLYVDGQLDGSYAYSSPLGSQDPVRVGALYSGSNAFNGTIDDVRIYSRALNSTEISQIYSNPTNLLYTVSKPDCEYSGGDTQVLQVPFTANQDQNQNAYYYAVVKAWGKGARGAAGVTVCGSLGQLCCSGNICTSGNICSGTTCVACGAVSQPCCSSSTCNSYLTCASGTCQCGGDGQPCCSGTTCNSGFACSASIICQACGTTGQLCCTGNTCDTGYVCLPNNPDTYRCSACGGTSQPCCSGNTCNFASLSCNTTSATCQSCGGSGQLCCTDNNCSATFACNTSFTPQPICTSCGASAGQLCCSGDNCTSPLACNTTATPQHVCYLNVSEVTCGILSTPNTVYTLNRSVSINGSTCFNVTAANVTINCNGYSITGNNTSNTYGVYSGQVGTKMNDCRISNFSMGVGFLLASSGSISRTNASTTSASGYGFYLWNAASSNVTNSTGTSISGDGIFIYGDGNTVSNSNFTSSSGYGIQLYSSSSTNITNSNGTSGSNYGIYLRSNANFNMLNAISGVSNSSYGIFLSSSNNNTITGSSGTSGEGSGIVLIGSSNNTISLSTGTSTASSGIFISGNSNTISNSRGVSTSNPGINMQASYTRVIGSNGSSTSGEGILLAGGSANLVSGSRGTSGTNVGISLSSTASNNISNSVGTSNDSHGIYLGSSSSNIINGSVGNATAGSGANRGIYITGGTSNTIANSTFYSATGMSAYFYSSANNNIVTNNTFSSPSALYIVALATSSGNQFALNNFTTSTATYYVSDTTGGNYFNATVNGINQGNIYPNVISGAVSVYGTANSSISGLYVGSSGSGYPYNNTTAGGKLSGPVVDYAPLTPFGCGQYGQPCCGSTCNAGYECYSGSCDYPICSSGCSQCWCTSRVHVVCSAGTYCYTTGVACLPACAIGVPDSNCMCGTSVQWSGTCYSSPPSC